jgi:hypothetical protein
MAINDSIYARTSGKKNAPVRIIPNEVKTILQKDLSDLRSRNVFDFDSDKVLKVDSRVAETPTIPAQECAVAFKDGKWTLEKPIVARAAEPDVLSLLNKILALHVTDFIVDDASNLSQYGLTSPAETLTITIKPQEELVLQIGAPVPGKPDQVYAQRATANSVFTLPKSAVDDVFTALPNVRDRHVMPFNPGKANSLAFSFGRKKGDAKIQNGVWHTLSTPAGHGDVGKITDILAHLNQLETTPVLKDSATDLKPFGLDQPQGKITVTLPGAEAPLTLLIGKDENKLLYVRNSIEPFIYTVDDHAFDFLPDGNLDLLDARAINLQLANVKSMRILAPPAPAILLTRSPGGTWSAANVKDRMVDSLKADTQASLFCQLLAQKWLGPVLPAYKLDHPVLVLTVQANDPKPTILTVGATLPDGTHAAQVTGTPTAFAIADGDFAVLNNSSLMPIPAVAAPPTNAPMTPVDPHQVKTD